MRQRWQDNPQAWSDMRARRGINYRQPNIPYRSSSPVPTGVAAGSPNSGSLGDGGLLGGTGTVRGPLYEGAPNRTGVSAGYGPRTPSGSVVERHAWESINTRTPSSRNLIDSRFDAVRRDEFERGQNRTSRSQALFDVNRRSADWWSDMPQYRTPPADKSLGGTGHLGGTGSVRGPLYEGGRRSGY